jgi:hypothetical protein
MPEDDPEMYSQWFVKNQPKSLHEKDGGGVLPEDLGVRVKYLKMV